MFFLAIIALLVPAGAAVSLLPCLTLYWNTLLYLTRKDTMQYPLKNTKRDGAEK